MTLNVFVKILLQLRKWYININFSYVISIIIFLVSLRVNEIIALLLILLCSYSCYLCYISFIAVVIYVTT